MTMLKEWIYLQKTYDGVHEALVSEGDWLLAQQKRQDSGHTKTKIHNLEHEHLLSGIVKCPVCGAGMYGNVARKKRKTELIIKTISLINVSIARKLTTSFAITENSGIRN